MLISALGWGGLSRDFCWAQATGEMDDRGVGCVDVDVGWFVLYCVYRMLFCWVINVNWCPGEDKKRRDVVPGGVCFVL